LVAEEEKPFPFPDRAFRLPSTTTTIKYRNKQKEKVLRRA
jgi:hypothetical protein